MNIKDLFKGIAIAIDKNGEAIYVGNIVEDKNGYQDEVYYSLDRAAFMIKGSAADIDPEPCNEDFSKCKLIA